MKKSPFDSRSSLKRTIVFADARTKKVVDGGLSVMAEVDRSSLSAAAEKLLLKALLTDRPEVSGPMSRVYSGECTVKEELARAFRNNAAGAYSEAASPHLLPLVRCAGSVLQGCVVDSGRDEHYHASSCWDSVVNRLSAAKDNAIARSLLDEAGDYGGFLADCVKVPIDGYLSLVIVNWRELGNYTYTFRALADIVEMAEEPPANPESIKWLLSALVECSEAGWRVV